MRSSSPSATERLASALVHGLRLELFLTPKPGLVDLLDAGSHPDLSLPRMLASIDLVGAYLGELTSLLARQAPLADLRAAGCRAEARMLACFRTNTHRGAIFLAGLLVTACARSPSHTPAALSQAAAELAAQLFAGQSPAGSHGHAVRRDFAAGGIIAEARAGLPSLFGVALPAYREGLRRWGDHHLAAFLVLARLMRTVEDTTALHRCGPAGLAMLRQNGAALEATLAGEDDPVPLLLRLNAEYRQMNLTMGGVADLLAMAFGMLDYWEWLPSRMLKNSLFSRLSKNAQMQGARNSEA